jgi:hypothetical protein
MPNPVSSFSGRNRTRPGHIHIIILLLALSKAAPNLTGPAIKFNCIAIYLLLATMVWRALVRGLGIRKVKNGNHNNMDTVSLVYSDGFFSAGIYLLAPAVVRRGAALFTVRRKFSRWRNCIPIDDITDCWSSTLYTAGLCNELAPEPLI